MTKSLEFNMTDWPKPKQFQRGGRAAVFDRCRKILVPMTSEEDVRQRFVEYLIARIGLPASAVYTEEPLSHYEGGGRRRLDIAVWDQKSNRTLLAVECKAPHVPLTDDVWEQLARYDEVVGARYLAITNGKFTLWYRPTKGDEYSPLERPPTKEELNGHGKTPVATQPAPTSRPSFGNVSDRAFDKFNEEGAIGKGSPREDYPYLFNLAGLLLFEGSDGVHKKWGRYTLLEHGIRNTTFGNAAGGGWAGQYRYFLLEDAQHESQIVSMCVLGKILVKNDPRFGNTNGHTTLIVAVDDFEKRHSSLQLDLDSFVRAEGDKMHVWHDGTLTTGKRGRAPRADVVSFIAKRVPELVHDGRICLGTFPRHRLAMWSDVKDLLTRLATYALIRDEFRRNTAPG